VSPVTSMTAVIMRLAFVRSPLFQITRWRHVQLRPAPPGGGSAARPSLTGQAGVRRPAIRPARHQPFG
jgi:hypothetical protein